MANSALSPSARDPPSITYEQSPPIDENERPGSAKISLPKQLEATKVLPVRRLQAAKELTPQQFRKSKLLRQMLSGVLRFPVQRAPFRHCDPAWQPQFLKTSPECHSRVGEGLPFLLFRKKD